ncbi:hypothetical protein FRC12_004248 [Ceratobasidium sp. 428]|nr:hypothetical protein FRC12_004248 [Ceratobasidium sp. 428]
MNRLTQNGTIPLGQSTQNQTNEWYAWNMRIAFKIQIQSYKTFTPSGNITQSIQTQIDEYNTNLTYPLQDWNNTSGSLGSLHFYQILTELLSSNLQTARYIVALAGLVLVFMGILDLSHSRPQGRILCQHCVIHSPALNSPRSLSMGCYNVAVRDRMVVDIPTFTESWSIPIFMGVR